MFTNSTELFNLTSDYFKSFPKTPDEIRDVLTKIKNVFESEQKHYTTMWKTYNKAIRGDASLNEITAANKQAHELLVATRFAFLVAVPGTLFLLPMLVKYAEDYGIDLVPASVKKEFDI